MKKYQILNIISIICAILICVGCFSLVKHSLSYKINNQGSELLHQYFTIQVDAFKHIIDISVPQIAHNYSVYDNLQIKSETEKSKQEIYQKQLFQQKCINDFISKHFTDDDWKFYIPYLENGIRKYTEILNSSNLSSLVSTTTTFSSNTIINKWEELALFDETTKDFLTKFKKMDVLCAAN